MLFDNRIAVEVDRANERPRIAIRGSFCERESFHRPGANGVVLSPSRRSPLCSPRS